MNAKKSFRGWSTQFFSTIFLQTPKSWILANLAEELNEKTLNKG
jgi:hypothetical protein